MGRVTATGAVLVALAGLLAGCSSTSAQTADGTAPSSCSVPDAGCMTARGFLSCTSSSGAGAGCLSDDLIRCLTTNATPGGGFTCSNQCASSEYGAACSSIGGATVGPPAARCRDVAFTPGGVFYCCACEELACHPAARG